MDEQFELFESPDQDWIKRLWKTLPAPSRQEVLDVLAQMGRAALRAQRAQAHSHQPKEVSDER